MVTFQMKTTYLVVFVATAMLFGATGSTIISSAMAQTKDAKNGDGNAEKALVDSNLPTSPTRSFP